MKGVLLNNSAFPVFLWSSKAFLIEEALLEQLKHKVQISNGKSAQVGTKC